MLVKVIIENRDTKTGQQTFMIGHGNTVTCLDVDRCGRYIASGAMNFMGFKVCQTNRMLIKMFWFFEFVLQTDVIIWDFFSGCKLGQYDRHLTRVNAVKFSNDGKYLMSIGNMDGKHIHRKHVKKFFKKLNL